MFREKRKHADFKLNRRLDAKSSRGVVFENETLRMGMVNLNDEVDRSKSEIRALRRENEQLHLERRVCEEFELEKAKARTSELSSVLEMPVNFIAQVEKMQNTDLDGGGQSYWSVKLQRNSLQENQETVIPWEKNEDLSPKIGLSEIIMLVLIILIIILIVVLIIVYRNFS